MARVTVEDCIEKVPNRFDLIVASAQRAREIGSGHPILVERDKDKNPVVALREIADGHITAEGMREKKVLALLRGDEEHDEEAHSHEQDDEATLLERNQALEAALGSELRGSFASGLGEDDDDDVGIWGGSGFGEMGLGDSLGLGDEKPMPSSSELASPVLYEDISDSGEGEGDGDGAAVDDE